MRIIPFAISAVLTIALVIVLNMSLGSVPPLGRFLSPQQGCWQNAEPVDASYSMNLNFPALKGKADVYFDERLVPHVFAEQEEDAYFIQGYLHARFRLWQMEFQTHAAAGRLSEILGAGPNNAILNFDRNMRRLGMVYGAKKAVTEMENDTATKKALDAYTAGVNAYIENLTQSALPLEYKLLNYLPEKWSSLKTALFLKYMSHELAADEHDIEYTNAKAVFSKTDFEKLYPLMPDSLDPIVPRGTPFAPPGVTVKAPASADSLYFQWKDSFSITPAVKPDKDNGSNNWAVAGKKTLSGRPILCNDPHLGLNMPSLWYEMQLSTPNFNAYGVSFPGAPSIVIGFNDSCAWGFTNAMRDVRDYYEVKFRDASRQEYLYNGEWRPTRFQVEKFIVKGNADLLDTVVYTDWGPVMYDRAFNGSSRVASGKNLAVHWKANDASNELLTFYLLDHAKNYSDYYNAIAHLQTPGQNCLFASKAGDIAIWQQASFPAKWRRQGDFVMPGEDSSFQWQANIPIEENPHLINPERGFVSSANQLPVDTTYPYYIGGHHDLYRGYAINRFLRSMNNITPEDMEQLQTENYNVFAEMAMPILLKNINEAAITDGERKYLDIARNWSLRNDPQEKGPVVFTNWVDSLQSMIWTDEFSHVPQPYIWPESYTLVEALRKDSAFRFVDNINTPALETLREQVTAAFKKIIPVLVMAEREGKLAWGKYKDTGIRHLLRLPALSRFHLNTGGGLNVINATKQYHGPSWRMVVQLTDKTEAYGIYPGGQSGNPGSKYYDTFVGDWAAGKYNTLWVMNKTESGSKRIKHTMTFSK